MICGVDLNFHLLKSIDLKNINIWKRGKKKHKSFGRGEKKEFGCGIGRGERIVVG